MFLYLMLVNFLIAVTVSVIVISLFSKPINSILSRIINDPINTAWSKYIKFSGMVVGISSGVRIYEIEKYITPVVYDKDQIIIQLTRDRWILEVYRTIIETLQGIAWMMLVFFVMSLFAYVIVRWSEVKYNKIH
jgi:hypothetical protein